MKFYVAFFFFCVTAISESAEISEADTVFAQKHYAAALELYSEARQTQKDDWKRLTIQIIRCCLAQGETERAVQEYFLLCRVDPTPPLEWIPLPWFVPVETAIGMSLREKTAEDWLDPLQKKPSNLAATLLAAGTLSASPDQTKRIRGYQLLRELEAILETPISETPKLETPKLETPKLKPKSEKERSNKTSNPTSDVQETAFRRHISLLAIALRWKQRIPKLRTQTELTPLRRILDQIPEPFRAGPLFLFGQAARTVGDHETAVLHWMRIPILYSENTPLSVEALRESALSLEKLGRFDQAERLRHEMIDLERKQLAPSR
jgi:tetratricopeptide (TPR) repeat protein